MSNLRPQEVQLPLGKVILELQRGHLLNTEIDKLWYTKNAKPNAASDKLKTVLWISSCTAIIGKKTSGAIIGHRLWEACNFLSSAISMSLGVLESTYISSGHEYCVT